MAETTTLPELGPVAIDIKSRLTALETGASGDYVTTEQLNTALEGKLDKTGTAAAATKATQDSDGNPIKSTYATKTELSGKQDKGDYLTTSTANTTYLKKADAQTTYLGISAKAASATTADSATTANSATTAASATKATQDASGNVITETYLTKSAAATTYLGISAKAASATSADSATKATQDASGNVITSTYGTKSEVGQRILTTGARGQIAGSETAASLSGSQTITADSADTICISTSGAVTLTFTAAAATVCAVKVIALNASATTTLTISGAVWANAGDAPTWGTAGKNLVLTASFINGRVVLNVYDNEEG